MNSQQTTERDDAVRAVLRRLLPNALRNVPLGRDDVLSLSHVHRGAVESLLRHAASSVPDELVASVRTWGDVFDWFGETLLSHRKPTPFGSPAAGGSRVRLRPLVPSDIEPLYLAASAIEQGFRWRYRGRTPSFSEFEQSLFDGVLAQFIVEAGQGRHVGLVTAYNADLANGFTYFGYVRTDGGSNAGPRAMVEGAALFIQYCFETWPLRKVYFQVPEYNKHLISGLVDSQIATVEGRLREHYFHDGQFFDELVAAVRREVWTERLGPWFAREDTG